MKYNQEQGLNPHQLLKLILTLREINNDALTHGIGLALSSLYEPPPIILADDSLKYVNKDNI